MANILEIIQKNDMVKVILVLLGIYLFTTYLYKNKSVEKYSTMMMPEFMENVAQEVKPILKQGVKPIIEQEEVKPDVQKEYIDKIVAGDDKVKADELLPKYDAESEFAKENPVSKLLKEQNFLISGFHAGINTVLQSNKLAYHDIRSLPPIPKESVGPWNQSSYEQSPAQMRRFFEIGA